jgi:uncharacterized protein YllA (UPF0747 family)
MRQEQRSVSGEPVVITESLGGSPLSRAARAGQLPQWYRAVPRGAEWHSYVSEVAASVPPTWYDALSPAFRAEGAALDRIQRSAGGKGIVVTTGQQPGMFGGALMTFVKAIAARALADTIEQTTGTPVAPVFWAATDDADFDEASVVSVALDGGARELRITERSVAGTPMARVPLAGRELDALAVALREACGSAAHPSYLEMALDAYRDGATVGDAYVALMRGVLQPLGIAVLDASHPAVLDAARSTLERAARNATSVADVVRRRNEDIVAAGLTPQVEEVADLSLVFANSDGTKRRLTLDEAPAARDATLSATVLVRPAMERAILPTAAYLGGPGEVAYFAQVNAVAEALGIPQPLVVPRWSTTILEPRIQRILDDFGADVSMLADPHALDGRIARQLMPPDVARALAEAREHAAHDADALRRSSRELMPAAAVDGMAKAIGHRLDRMERRLLAAVKRRETDAMRRIATARGSLFPHGVRQERKLSFIPFLARYGAPLVEQMLEAARAHARAIVAGTPSMTPPPASAPARV